MWMPWFRFPMSIYNSEKDCTQTFEKDKDYKVIYLNFFNPANNITREIHIFDVWKEEENHKTMLVVRFKDKEYKKENEVELLRAFKCDRLLYQYNSIFRL